MPSSLYFSSKPSELIGRAGLFYLTLLTSSVSWESGAFRTSSGLTEVAAFVYEWQAIYNGARVHVGKGATFGLGR